MDFVYTVSPEKAKEHVLSVHDPQINVDIALSPTEGGEYKAFHVRSGMMINLSLCNSISSWYPSTMQAIIHRQLWHQHSCQCSC